MKRILSILAAIGITATTASVVVSCQTEIKGQALIDLAQKLNADEVKLVLADAPTDSKALLQDEIVVLLTHALVKDYDMNAEGYFKTSKFQTLTVGQVRIIVEGITQEDEVKSSDLEGSKNVVFVIEDVQFNFQIEFTFSSKTTN